MNTVFHRAAPFWHRAQNFTRIRIRSSLAHTSILSISRPVRAEIGVQAPRVGINNWIVQAGKALVRLQVGAVREDPVRCGRCGSSPC